MQLPFLFELVLLLLPAGETLEHTCVKGREVREGESVSQTLASLNQPPKAMEGRRCLGMVWCVGVSMWMQGEVGGGSAVPCEGWA